MARSTFSLFPSARRRLQALRIEVILTREGEKARKENGSFPAVMFRRPRCGKIVMEDFLATPPKASESVNVGSAQKCRELWLCVELDLVPAMRLCASTNAKSVGVTLVTGAIIERSKMSPVHFEAFAGERFPIRTKARLALPVADEPSAHTLVRCWNTPRITKRA